MDDRSGSVESAVRQAVRGEHRDLGELFLDVGRVFREPGDLEETRDSFAALSEMLDVHFEQEDRLYYASIGALRPDLKPEIRAISEAHRHFRLELAAIADQLERGDLDSARRSFIALEARFRRHEAMEEILIRDVDAEISEAG
jgi:hypothetical protein